MRDSYVFRLGFLTFAWGLDFLLLGVTNSCVCGLVFSNWGVRNSYVCGLDFLLLLVRNLFLQASSFFTFGSFEFLRLGVKNSYVWGLILFRFGG